MKISKSRLAEIIKEEVERSRILSEREGWHGGHSWQGGLSTPHTHVLDEPYRAVTGDRNVFQTGSAAAAATEEFIEDVVEEIQEIPDEIEALGNQAISTFLSVAPRVQSCIQSAVSAFAISNAALATSSFFVPWMAMYAGVRGDKALQAGRILWEFSQMKERLDMHNADAYFHYIAFGTAAKYLKSQGLPNWEVTMTLRMFGQGKELLDYINCLKSTAWDAGEWSKDMDINRSGIAAGLRGERLCNGAQAVAIANGMKTVGQIKNQEGWQHYSWAWEEYPEVYADDKLFIPPRYNCSLTKEQRDAAWDRQMDPNDEKPSSDLRAFLGPLRIS